MTLSQQYLYGFKMIELYDNKQYDELDHIINTLKDIGSLLLFELKYKFLASEELINYISKRLPLNKRYPVVNSNVKEIILNGNNNEQYLFKYKEISSLLINNKSLNNFLLSNEDFVSSFLLKIKYNDNLSDNIKSIASNKYIATDIVSFSVIYENEQQIEIGLYWYSDSLESINYLQRAAIVNEEVVFTFNGNMQTRNYFNSYALEELIKCSKEYSYDQIITSDDILDIKIMYVNLTAGSIFNDYKFIEEDILKLINLEVVALVFENDEELEVNIAKLNNLTNLKEIIIKGDKIRLKGTNEIIGKKITFE